MEATVEHDEQIIAVANEYLTPNGIRKIVRRPKVGGEPQHLTIPFGDGIISFNCWGEGEPVLLVHGWSANQTDMFGYVPSCVEAGCCAVTIDLPAHGESSGNMASLEDLGDGILAIARHIGRLKALISHSTGGAATQVALSKGLVVDKVVMLASPQDYELNIRRFAVSKGFSEFQADEVIQVLKERGIRVEIKSADMVPQFESKGLIVHSKDDQVIPYQTALALNGYWRESSLLLLDGLGHRGILKDPSVIAEVINFAVG